MSGLSLPAAELLRGEADRDGVGRLVLGPGHLDPLHPVCVPLDAATPLTGIRHLKSVTLHFWETGRIVVLYPLMGDHGELFPGQYAPAFFAASTTPAEHDESRIEEQR